VFISMLETPDYPTLARVIRVQPLPDEKPASGFSWGDYEDVRVTTDGGENDADGEDDGWGVVRTRRQSLFYNVHFYLLPVMTNNDIYSLSSL
jgi:hypothetical protein